MGNVGWMVPEGGSSDKQAALTVSFSVARLPSKEQLGYWILFAVLTVAAAARKASGKARSSVATE
jgi:hypothetical protein